LHLLESRVGNHIRAVYRFRRVERRGWIFSHLAALFVRAFPGRDVSLSSQEEEQQREQQQQQQRDACENEEGFKRLLSIGFRIVR
tara:strand:- start:71 stop:325 length:255 start_codon:yes stop_codon:yes gene_type:complete